MFIERLIGILSERSDAESCPQERPPASYVIVLYTKQHKPEVIEDAETLPALFKRLADPQHAGLSPAGITTLVLFHMREFNCDGRTCTVQPLTGSDLSSALEWLNTPPTTK